MNTFFRGRRLRMSSGLREMARETDLLPRHLIMPYFVVDSPDSSLRKPVASMPGVFQLSLDQLEREVEGAVQLGLGSVILFGIPAHKDPEGSGAYAEDGIIQRAVRRLRAAYPELVIITDVCLCEYTSHGHCGLVTGTDHSE